MKIIQIEKPESYEPISADCPDHWFNIIVFGGCSKHNPDGSMKTLFDNQPPYDGIRHA